MHKKPITKVAAYLEANKSSLRTEATSRLGSFANKKVKEAGLAIKSYKYTFPFHVLSELTKGFTTLGKLLESHTKKKAPYLEILLPDFFVQLGMRAGRISYVLMPLTQTERDARLTSLPVVFNIVGKLHPLRAIDRYIDKVITQAEQKNILRPGMFVYSIGCTDIDKNDVLVRHWCLRIDLLNTTPDIPFSMYNLMFHLSSLVKVIQNIQRLVLSEVIKNAAGISITNRENPKPAGNSLSNNQPSL